LCKNLKERAFRETRLNALQNSRVKEIKDHFSSMPLKNIRLLYFIELRNRRVVIAVLVCW